MNKEEIKNRKATLNQALKHLKGFENKNPSFNGEVVFCKKANEYVVNDISNNIHLHITDNLEDCAYWEKEIFKND